MQKPTYDRLFVVALPVPCGGATHLAYTMPDPCTITAWLASYNQSGAIQFLPGTAAHISGTHNLPGAPARHEAFERQIIALMTDQQ